MYNLMISAKNLLHIYDSLQEFCHSDPSTFQCLEKKKSNIFNNIDWERSGRITHP